MSADAKTHFTAVLSIHTTTTETAEVVSRRDNYGRTIAQEPKPQKTSNEVLKLQLRGETLSEVADKAASVLEAMGGAL